MIVDLRKAWSYRLELIVAAKASLSKAASLDKDRFTAPKNCKIAVWGASMEAYYASEKARAEANILFSQADSGWTAAVMEEKGNVRAEWSDGVNGWNCKLETGEEFLS